MTEQVLIALLMILCYLSLTQWFAVCVKTLVAIQMEQREFKVSFWLPALMTSSFIGLFCIFLIGL